MGSFLVSMIYGAEGFLSCDKRLFLVTDLIPEESFNILWMTWISYTGLVDIPVYAAPITKENQDVSCQQCQKRVRKKGKNSGLGEFNLP